MASNIPTRRITRATRANANENVNAKPSRIITRTKALASTITGASTSTKMGGDVDAGAQGKRKREALHEVTGKAVNHNKSKQAEGKGKGKDDAPVKPGKSSTSATVVTRQPLRTTATRQGGTVLAEKKSTLKRTSVDEMAVDPPHLPPPVVLVSASQTTTTTTSRRTTSRTTNVVAESRPSTRSTSRRQPAVFSREPESEVVEEEPAHKKRRTSSELGDHLEAVEEDDDVAENDVVQVLEDDQDWDDLDRDDNDDPLMVSEYVVEIFNYLKEVEQTTMPNANYMENQKELAWKMRGILMDWLIQVHSRFKLLSETLYLCVNLIDRFLSARVVSLAKLQLVGVTCMFIAAKTEETVAPSVKNFIYCADSAYTEADILMAEKYILKTLEWNLSYPSPLNFLRRVSKADYYNPQTRTLGKYLLEIGCLEWRLLAAPPSLLAAAAIWLARLILDQPDWSPNLRHYSSYPEEHLIPTANLMLNYILKPITHESFFKKYASKKYMKSSVFVRQWALERWPERTLVNLHEELPQLKEMALLNQEAAAEAAFAEAEAAEGNIPA